MSWAKAHGVSCSRASTSAVAALSSLNHFGSDQLSRATLVRPSSYPDVRETEPNIWLQARDRYKYERSAYLFPRPECCRKLLFG